ncbi:Smr/MutS family protein [Thermaurantiacus sp.]
MTRRLSAEEEAIWRRVAATVKAYRPLPEPSPPAPAADPPSSTLPDRAGVGAVKSKHRPAAAAPRAQPPAETLDARWDQRLQSGKARPDRIIDLHGMTRSMARERLRAAVFQSHAHGERLILVITGKGALPGPEPADLMGAAAPRGVIRAELPRWLGEPDLSTKVAAVRQASPSQGGIGAVWLVLRRQRHG